MSHAASDSHSVDREENTPSSDTETVGGVSNVSINASSSAVALEPDMVDDIVVGRAVREAIRGLDALDISSIFSRRASVMRSPPKFLSGAFRSAMRVALHEIVTGTERHDESVQCRGWKLFMLLPRLLLFRLPRGGNISKLQLLERFSAFSRGEWDSCCCNPKIATKQHPEDSTDDVLLTLTVQIAELTGPSHSLIMMGEVSAGRQALEGAPLDQLQDPVRRPAVPYSPLPEAIRNHQAEIAFSSEKEIFMKNLKCARRGAAAGPSGMTSEHLKSILENARDCELLFQVAQFFARARIPHEILEALRVGRLTALQKPNGGVCGIVAGDVFRRLVASCTPSLRLKVVSKVTHSCALCSPLGHTRHFRPCKRNSRKMSAFSHSWTTSTLCVRRTGSMPPSVCCRMRSSSIQPSVFTMGKHKFGTEEAWCRLASR